LPKGSTVIVSGNIEYDLWPVIEMDRTTDEYVKLMDERCKVNKNFKLIFLLDEFPPMTEWMHHHTTILNFTLTQSAMQYHLLNTLHSLEHPSSCNQHITAM